MANHDEIIKCAKSGGDLCYKIEVSKDITQYMSLSCGFWTNTLMKIGTDFYEEQVGLLPEIYKDLLWLDPNTELIWIPNTINIPELGMVYASGNNKEEWCWSAVKAVLNEEELNSDDSKPKYKMDMSTLSKFNERDYIDALSYIGILPT
jgi:hypothetical protein